MHDLKQAETVPNEARNSSLAYRHAKRVPKQDGTKTDKAEPKP